MLQCPGFIPHENERGCFGCPRCNPEQYGSMEDPLIYYDENEDILYSPPDDDLGEDEFDPMDEVDWEYIETGR